MRIFNVLKKLELNKYITSDVTVPGFDFYKLNLRI
jgi:hypothetical protein